MEAIGVGFEFSIENGFRYRVVLLKSNDFLGFFFRILVNEVSGEF